MAGLVAVLDRERSPHAVATALLDRIGAGELVVRGRAALGQTRGATAGAFPAEARGGVVAIADLRLDDRGGLAGELGLDATRSDAELLLAGYERWGRALAEHLV